MHYPRTERQAEFMALADRLAEQIAQRAAEHDREGTFPHEAFQLLHESGYLALTVPEEYGGRGAIRSKSRWRKSVWRAAMARSPSLRRCTSSSSGGWPRRAPGPKSCSRGSVARSSPTAR